MKNIKHRVNGWQSRLRDNCERLTQKQRMRLILILSTIYFAMAVVTFVWIYIDSRNGKTINVEHIKNPIPMLKKGLRFEKKTDSVPANPQNEE